MKCRRSDGGKNHDLIMGYNDHQEAFYESQKEIFDQIEQSLSETDAKGKMPLWSGYGEVEGYPTKVGPNAKRNAAQVRTGRGTCQFYAWLATQKKPKTILEFGAAFGASGMYWLAGLKNTSGGKLISFEPNKIWSKVAKANFETVSDDFLLTEGTFEDNVSLVTPKANITLIDAIHTKAFVLHQFELVKKVSAKGAIVLFDDISFSNDMRDCWREVIKSPDAASVWQIGGRVGIIELR